MKNLALPLISHVVACMMERYPHSPSPLPPVVGGRPGPGVMRAELALPPTSCRTQQSRPCVSFENIVKLTLVTGAQVS